SKYINRSFKENGEWYNMEKEWREAIESEDQVKNIKIEVQYRGDSQRPTEFQVEYEINNRQYEKRIPNI
ncbi:DNA/RNA non-specific endonuclease, partial [Staphylococcus epidermidis]